MGLRVVQRGEEEREVRAALDARGLHRACARGGRRGIEEYGRRGGAFKPFAFESIGTSLTILQDRRGLPSSQPVGTWTNLAPGKTADFTAAGTARPGLGVVCGIPAGDWINDLGGADDNLGSTQTLAQTVAAGVEWGIAVFDPDFVKGTSTAAWPNGCVIGDTGGFHGVFVRDTSGGSFGPTYEVQVYAFDGAAKIAKLALNLDKAPVAIEWVRSGGLLTVTDIYTGASDSIAVGNITTLTGTMRMGFGGTNRFDGRIALVAQANAVPSTSVREAAKAKIRAEFPPNYYIAAATSNLWGNDQPAVGLDSGTGPAWSPLSMLVIETDSPTVGVISRETAGTVAEYSDCALVQGTTSQKYGTTELKQIARAGSAVVGERRRDTGLVPGSGSGTRRYFAVSAPWSAGVKHSIEKIYVPEAYRGTTSVVAQPATGTICVDGYGGRLAEDASDGIVVAGGVLDGGAGNVSLRAAAATRVALMGCTHMLIPIGVNDGRSGTSQADFGVALGAIADIGIAAGILAANIRIVSIPKQVQTPPSTEPAYVAGYRTEAASVTTAKSLGALIDGSLVPGLFSQLGPDGIHMDPPPDTAEADLAACFASFGTAGRLLVWTDSIFSGSTDPASWSAARGVIAIARGARA